jgi:hypothetical protein
MNWAGAVLQTRRSGLFVCASRLREKSDLLTFDAYVSLMQMAHKGRVYVRQLF